jgi:hypothetical protein
MRIFMKKMLVFSVNASSYFGKVERSVAIGPSWRQETEKFEGNSLRPKGGRCRRSGGGLRRRGGGRRR